MAKKFDMKAIRPKDRDYVDQAFEETSQQMEEDSQGRDFSNSEEWETDFWNSLMAGKDEFKKEQRKKRTLVNVAAGIALVTLIGIGVRQEETIADCLGNIFDNESKTADVEYDHFGTDEELVVNTETEKTVYYNNKTLTEVYAQIKEDLKRSIFQIKDGFGTYEIEDAFYQTDFDVIVIKLVTEEGKIFVSQKEVFDKRGLGVESESDSITVWNENLQQDIVISKSIQDDSYTFSVKKDYIVFNFNGYVSAEMCSKIAENLSFE